MADLTQDEFLNQLSAINLSVAMVNTNSLCNPTRKSLQTKNGWAGEEDLSAFVPIGKFPCIKWTDRKIVDFFKTLAPNELGNCRIGDRTDQNVADDILIGI